MIDTEYAKEAGGVKRKNIRLGMKHLPLVLNQLCMRLFLESRS